MIKISDESIRDKLEDVTERVLYASRWILSPIYLALIFVLILIMGKFFMNVYEFTLIMGTLTTNEWIIHIPELLDLTLLANLVLIVTFSGYENFVSKIDVAENHVDRLHGWVIWTFQDLNLKSLVQLLQYHLLSYYRTF